jgi:WD40 repeat protein/transcriptional regulator with XRE-family HTH domain
MAQEGAGPDDAVRPSGIQTRREFAEALTALRESAGRTVRKVAAETGQAPATVGDYFSGRHLPPLNRPVVLTGILAACGVGDDEAVDAWFEALRRVRRRRPTATANPYPGLVHFDGTDAANFFGREELTTAIATRVAGPSTTGLFVVLGASGSGKSSLLRAGVAPALASHEDGAHRITLFTPGNDPMGAWAAALSDAPMTTGPRVTIVDQFEEVFTLVAATARRAFITALTEEAADHVVLVALRGDFFGEAAAEPLLLDSLENRQIIVGPLTDAQLEAAIVEPARRAGSEVEPGLVQLLLGDVRDALTQTGPTTGGSPDLDQGETWSGAGNAAALPRLAHALQATWEATRGQHLTAAAYQQTGGVRGAVLQSAEEAWARLDEAEQDALRALFLRLTAYRTRLTGRPVPLEELDLSDRTSPLATAIGSFVDARLLTVDAVSVRVAHESLLSEWPRAVEWLVSTEQDLATRRAISTGALEWAPTKDDAILLRGSRLAAAQELTAAGGSSDLSATEQRYVEASTARSQSELRRERSRTRRLRTLVAAVTVLAVVIAGLAAFFARSTVTARQQRDEALSRQIATESARITRQDPALAAELAVAAYQVSPTLEARSALLNATSLPSVSRLVGPEGLVRTELSPDGSLLAVAHADGTVQTWPRDSSTGRFGRSVVTRVAPEGTTLFALAFAPDGQTLVVGGGGDEVTLLDLRADAPTPEPRRLSLPGGAYSVAFNPSGTLLAAGRVSGGVALYQTDAPDGVAPGPELDFPAPVQALAFGPDGLLATAGNDAVLRLFRPASTGYQPAGSLTLGDASNTLFSLAFSPDGQHVAVGSRDKQVRVVDVSDADRPKEQGSPLTGFDSWVNTVTYSTDGTRLAAGSSDSTVRLFDVADGALLTTLPTPSPVTDLSFLPDGSHIAFGSLDGITRVWQVTGPGTPLAADTIAMLAYSRRGTELMQATLSGEGAIRMSDVSEWRHPRLLSHVVTEPGPDRLNGAAAMTADGRLIATGSGSGHVLLWDSSTPGALTRRALLTEPTALVEWLSFSGDGTLLASGDDANEVHLWDVADPDHPRHLSTLTGPTSVVLGVAVSPDGRHVAAASADRKVWLWDLADPARPGPAQPLGDFSNYAYTVTFSPDSRLLAAGSTDRTIRMWSLHAGSPATEVGLPLAGLPSDVLSVAFNRDGSHLAAGTRGGHIWEWDVTDPAAPEHRATLNPEVGVIYTVTYSPTQDLIAAGGSSKQSVQLLADPATAAKLVCESVVDPISPAEWAVHVPGVTYRSPCQDPAAP